MDRYSIRTDLAVEAREMRPEEISGVEVENRDDGDVKITKVTITNREGEEALGKPMGRYVTVEAPRLRENDTKIYEDACRVVARELEAMIDIPKDAGVLVAGLGNWNITPDSIGPKVVSELLVTRHLFEQTPKQLQQGLRPVSAVAPGVLGLTGIETGEIIKGIVDKIKPAMVIAVDALASRRTQRVSTTIQFTDTGISPGSGVGNNRHALTRETLGVPVIAIGVPMVVEAATVASDAIEAVIEALKNEAQNGSSIYKSLSELDKGQRYNLIKEVLPSDIRELIVTPKEVDSLADRVSKLIANGINIALHEAIKDDDINMNFS